MGTLTRSDGTKVSFEQEVTVANLKERLEREDHTLSETNRNSETHIDDSLSSLQRTYDNLQAEKRFYRNRLAYRGTGQINLQELTVDISEFGTLGSIVTGQLCRSGGETVEIVDDTIVVGCVGTAIARSYYRCCPEASFQSYIIVGVSIEVAEADEQAICKTGYIHLVAPRSTTCFDCLGRHDQTSTQPESIPQQSQRHRRRGYSNDDELPLRLALISPNGICASQTVSVGTESITGAVPLVFPQNNDHDVDLTKLATVLRLDTHPVVTTANWMPVAGFEYTRFVSEKSAIESDATRSSATRLISPSKSQQRRTPVV